MNKKIEELQPKIEKLYERLIDTQHKIHIDSKLISPTEIADIFDYITQLSLINLTSQNKIDKIQAFVDKADVIGLSLIYYGELKQILKDNNNES